jgi:hypothetical protein
MQDIDSHIHFRHAPAEVEDLSHAIIGMAEYISAVARDDEKYKLKLILRSKYFRARDARNVTEMLRRACKYARAHLSDYFPTMQQGILSHAENLEDATERYYRTFERLKEESAPVH